MSTLTSSLVVRLIDQVTAPARAVSKSLFGLNKAAQGNFGDRLAGAMENNREALDRARGGLVDAAAGFLLLKQALGAPVKAAIDFETLLEDMGQKANIPVDRLAILGTQIKEVARDTNQATMDIASAVDNLLGRGAAEDVALAAAAPIGKAATAYRAATDDLAAASWSAVDNLKVPADQIETAIDAMAQAGKEGAFELRDMAKYFPSLGAAYQGLGQTGTDAVADLAAALQIVRKGTGDSSSAATNLQNVLQKIGSPATLRAFKKMGVSLQKEMKKAGDAGLTPIEAIAEITNKTLKGDLGKLGFLFEDAQVQQGMRSLIQNMGEYRRIREEAMRASGVVEADYKRRVETAAGATIRWRASIENLSISLGTTLLPVMADIINNIVPIVDAIGKWTSENSDLTRAVISAVGGLVAFKIALSGLKFVGLLGRGGVLSMLSLGFNTVGRAAIGATRAVKNAVGLQAALGAMSGTKLTGLQTVTTALKAMALAVPGVSAISGALSAVGAALATISAPAWGLIAVGVAAVAAAGALMWKYWDRITSVVSGVARVIGEELQPVFDALGPALEPVKVTIRGIGDAFSYLSEKISAVAGWLGSFFEKEVLSEGDKAKLEQSAYDIMKRIVEAIKSGTALLFDVGAQMVQSLWDGMLSKIDALIEWVKTIPSRITAAIGRIDLSNIISLGGLLGGGGDAPANDNSGGGQVSGHRKRGGPAARGGSYVVGDGDEPEIFTPKTGGTITPASKAGATYTVSIGDLHFHGIQNEADFARKVEDVFDRAVRRSMRGVHADLEAR